VCASIFQKPWEPQRKLRIGCALCRSLVNHRRKGRPCRLDNVKSPVTKAPGAYAQGDPLVPRMFPCLDKVVPVLARDQDLVSLAIVIVEAMRTHPNHHLALRRRRVHHIRPQRRGVAKLISGARKYLRGFLCALQAARSPGPNQSRYMSVHKDGHISAAYVDTSDLQPTRQNRTESIPVRVGAGQQGRQKLRATEETLRTGAPFEPTRQPATIMNFLSPIEIIVQALDQPLKDPKLPQLSRRAVHRTHAAIAHSILARKRAGLTCRQGPLRTTSSDMDSGAAGVVPRNVRTVCALLTISSLCRSYRCERTGCHAPRRLHRHTALELGDPDQKKHELNH